MIPMLAPSSSPYHDVFEYQHSFFLSAGYVALLCALVVVPPVLAFLLPRVVIMSFSWARVFFALAFGIVAAMGLVALGAANLGSPHDNSENAMSQNVKIKYHAFLKMSPDKDTFEADSFLTNLDTPKPYRMTFENGITGTYMMRFDPATSEPFILSPEPPMPSATAQELNAAVQQQAQEAQRVQANTYDDIYNLPVSFINVVEGFAGVALFLFGIVGIVSVGYVFALLVDREGRRTEPKKRKTIGLTAFVTCVAVVAGCGSFLAAHPDNRLRDAMTANLQKKYGAGATVISYDVPSTGGRGGSIFPNLKNDNPYQLVFNNGRSGQYMVRWNPDTSEPFIENSPVPPLKK